MNFIGNTFLILSGLLFCGIVYILYNKDSGRSDVASAYVWSMIFLHLAFFICMGIVAGIIGSKGGFVWVGSYRFLFITVGLVLAVAGSCLWTFFKIENGPGMVLPRLGGNIFPVLILLSLLWSSLILLNEHWRAGMSAPSFQWPLILSAIIGALGLGIFVILLLVQEMRHARSRAEAHSAFEESTHQNYLNEIDSTDLMTGLVHLLRYTDANHYPDVRERALAKIKSRPAWQDELIRLLRAEGTREAFTFLASNEVENPVRFAESVREGLLIEADLIRRDLRNAYHASDLYPDLFYWQVERALLTANKFGGLGVDYRPAVEELRRALDEPIEMEKPAFRCIRLLDRWLKEHPFRH